MNHYTFSISDHDDFYDVTLHGYIIARITHYYGGSRQDVQFADVPPSIQDEIVRRVKLEVED